jgi:hypothetical protein
MIQYKRVWIWRFTLALIKINYGQIGDQTELFYTTNPVFYTSGNRFVRRTISQTGLICKSYMKLVTSSWNDPFYTVNVKEHVMWVLPGLDINVCPIVRYQWKLTSDKYQACLWYSFYWSLKIKTNNHNN